MEGDKMSELNIGGSNMTVELRGNKLQAKANTGNKQWVAVITDTHPTYNYDREFVAYQKPKTSNRDSGTATVEDGAVIERVRYTHSGKTRKDQFYQLVDGEAHQIDEVDVEDALAGDIIPDVDDEDGDEECEMHECDECDDAFDSAHGLAIHVGMVHSEDEEEADERSATDTASEAVATDGGTDESERWSVSEAIEHSEFVPLDMANNIDDDRVRERIAWVDGCGRAYAHSLAASPALVADGGIEDVKSKREARHDDSLVREYSADGHLYAYRDGDDHVIVSNGREPHTRWERVEPAIRRRLVPGQKLWTIPDNWELRIFSKRDDHARGLYFEVETELWADISIPTNNYLVDAWYSVQAVGALDAETVGDLGSLGDAYGVADELDDVDEALADGVREVARNWRQLGEAYDHDLEYAIEDGPWWDDLQAGEYVSVSSDFVFEAAQALYRPDLFVEDAIELPDGISARDVTRELREAGLLPNPYEARFSVDGSDIGMRYLVRALIETGCSATAALDYHMVECEGLTQTAWADERGGHQPTVSDNVATAKRHLDA